MQNNRGIMITVAPNGARRTKADHPRLPVTADEIATTAKSCLKAGAAILHLHVRDKNACHSLDTGLYLDAMTAVRGAVGEDMIIQVTTEAAGQYKRAEQMQMVRDLRPEAVSLALREIIPDSNGEQAAYDFFSFLIAEKIWPQFILYNAAELERLITLQQRGVIPFAEPFLLFVLGSYGTRKAVPEDLAPFLDVYGTRHWPWALCAFGSKEALCMDHGTAQGGHLRVGFENNIYNPDGSLVNDNEELVERGADAARKNGRSVLNARQIREMVIKWAG